LKGMRNYIVGQQIMHNAHNKFVQYRPTSCQCFFFFFSSWDMIWYKKTWTLNVWINQNF